MEQTLHFTSNLTSYNSLDEALADELLLLDVKLELLMERLAQSGASQDISNQTMYVSPEEAGHLLHGSAENSDSSAAAPAELLIHELEQRIARKMELTTKLPVSYPYCQLRFDPCRKAYEWRALMVGLAPHRNGKYGKLYGYVQDDMTRQYVTLDLLLQLCCSNQEERNKLTDTMLQPDSWLRAVFAPAQAQLSYDPSFLKAGWTLEPFMIRYLQGMEDACQPPYEEKLSEAQLQKVPALLSGFAEQDTLLRHAEAQCEGGNKIRLLLYGSEGSGKNMQAKQFCLQMKYTYMSFNLRFASTEPDLFERSLNTFFFRAGLHKAVAVLDDMHCLFPESETGSSTAGHTAVDRRMQWLMRKIDNLDIPVILLSRMPLRSWSGSVRPMVLELPPPSYQESIQLWQSLTSSQLELADTEARLLAEKFKFYPGTVVAAADAARQAETAMLLHVSAATLSQEEKVSLLHKCGSQVAAHQLGQKAVKLEPKLGWQDLILPTDTLSLLQQACNRVKNRHTVMYEWGFERLMPYGKGVSMLFTGPPGTGKTMSALVMAKQMDADLYRVDLSRVVSKYIGETEKNLGEIFDQARQSGAVLFFDEADALFGKRSEVKDAHDKYANMETSYLLQKMEEYEGMTILATNFAQNLDEAFTRRIQFIIKYPFPDKEQREQLWRSLLPQRFHTEEIDFPFLSDAFEMTGGPIKNIVLTAAYLAAAEGVSIQMKHLIEGAIQEYKKTGKLLLKDRLGSYAQYWKG